MTIILRLVLGIALVLANLVPAAAQGVPGGSYQQSCVNIRVRGSALHAQCTAPNGARIGSSVQLPCRGDIANSNGYLRCQGGGYGGGNRPGYGGPGYGYGVRPPQGSYLSSCRNVAMQGGMLSAVCSAANGRMTSSSLAVQRCRPGTDIANIDGRLNCLAYR